MIFGLLAGCGKFADSGASASSSPTSTDTAIASPGVTGAADEIKGEITWATHKTELVDTD